MNTIRVLVTGASTSLGKEVLKQLLKNSYCKVIVFESFTSKKEKYFIEYNENISIVYGNILDKKDIALVTKNIDVVIHLLPVIHFLDDNNTKLAYTINVQGTINLLACLKKYSPQAFFLLASSMSVYGDRVQNPMISLADPLAPSHFDYSAKIKIEVEDLVKSSGLEWSIFRLAALMGYGNYKLGGLIFDMPLETSLEIITPKDAASAFINAISRKDSIRGNIYNIGGGETC
ncbi:MAG: NAD(P)-dependent oxidoreductase, partial [Candidatus Azobacteroides sp.]|nr:NAD(P)-dependent oxidoreductase [Candidatus Azobacteroides sp.]